MKVFNKENKYQLKQYYSKIFWDYINNTLDPEIDIYIVILELVYQVNIT